MCVCVCVRASFQHPANHVTSIVKWLRNPRHLFFDFRQCIRHISLRCYILSRRVFLQAENIFYIVWLRLADIIATGGNNNRQKSQNISSGQLNSNLNPIQGSCLVLRCYDGNRPFMHENRIMAKSIPCNRFISPFWKSSCVEFDCIFNFFCCFYRCVYVFMFNRVLFLLLFLYIFWRGFKWVRDRINAIDSMNFVMLLMRGSPLGYKYASLNTK